MDELITVFTPTYNRSSLLLRVYKKLCKQTSKNFIWLIIDDGSTDGTASLVSKLITRRKINIEYYFQNNAGKQRAVNTALKLCHTPCFSFCDSDDWYLPETIHLFEKNYKKYRSYKRFCGIVARRGNQKMVCKNFSKIKLNEEFMINLPTLYTKYGFHAETCAMFLTEKLRECQYPEIEDKFIPESYMFDKLSQKYDVFFVNSVYSITEYLNDGYTKQSFKLYHNNPVGVYYALREAYYTNYGFIKNIKNGAVLLCWRKKYRIYNMFFKKKNYIILFFSFLVFCICFFLRKPDWIWNE